MSTMALDMTLDALYCEEEEKWDTEFVDENEPSPDHHHEPTSNGPDSPIFPNNILTQDLLWDDDELQSLFAKEKEACLIHSPDKIHLLLSLLSPARKEAVDWILKIKSHYGFSALTVILAVNYLDRFLLTTTTTLNSPKDQKQQPAWMMQLTAVTCLSLAAKVEETYVPLLIDLQVEGTTKYVFEAKTIQRMEILVLSSLKWRMNPVTPLSFLDHIVRRLGLKSYLHWEFLNNCENLLLSVISDSRMMRCMPSVLATAIMLHVIHEQVELGDSIAIHDYENQLLGVLHINKEEVDECYELISEILSKTRNGIKKRKSAWHNHELVDDHVDY